MFDTVFLVFQVLLKKKQNLKSKKSKKRIYNKQVFEIPFEHFQNKSL